MSLVSRLFRGPLRMQIYGAYLNHVSLIGNVGKLTLPAAASSASSASSSASASASASAASASSASAGGNESPGYRAPPSVARLSLAVSKPTGKAMGPKKVTQWFNVVVFKPSLHKLLTEKVEVGSKVFLSGSINMKVIRVDGLDKNFVEIVADEISVLTPKKIKEEEVEPKEE